MIGLDSCLANEGSNLSRADVGFSSSMFGETFAVSYRLQT